MLHVREIGWVEPLVAAALWRDDPFFAFLDSACAPGPRARYSYIAVEPFQVLSMIAGQAFLDGTPISLEPFALLDRELARFRRRADGPAPFTGGAIGFLGYELGRYLDRQDSRHADDLDVPEMAVGFYDTIVAFDRERRRAWIVCAGLAHPDAAERPAYAAATAARLAARLAEASPLPVAATALLLWRSDMGRNAYLDRVRRIREHIAAGDIFQANFTTRFVAERSPDITSFDIFRNLREQSPAPFAAFLACGGGIALASASPERFVQLTAEGDIEARPIKGTRPRAVDPDEDARLARELAASAKDRAENLMIADLLRNDIGRVAAIGSVAVPALMTVESFASVHHLVSAVTGRLRPGLGPVDLLRAVFPCGSVTGAPKLRAMEIIDAEETRRRGPYCGALGWIGFDGAMDMSVVIRTLIITPTRIAAHAGGGIVADSRATAEYEEMLLKLRPLLGKSPHTPEVEP